MLRNVHHNQTECGLHFLFTRYHQEDVKHAGAGKEKKGEAQEEMAGLHQGMKEYKMTEDMARNRSV